MAQLPENLLQVLKASPAGRYWVAYSGGLDSHVLLQASAAVRDRLGAEIRAVHVHHGLHDDADEWTRHCERICAALGVPLQVVRVDARCGPGESPEESARTARYQAFSELVTATDCLLLAHHKDDQAETLLLQLLRGAGPHGLAAMPGRARFAEGWLARPLLNFTRSQLHDYAGECGLQWVEDSSNAELGFDRNYLRHEILPRLCARWPAAADTLARSAGHCADAAHLLDQLAAADLDAVRAVSADCLSVSKLAGLPESRQRNLLRAWLQSLGLPTPTTSHLRHVVSDTIHAAWDATPCVRWEGAEVRRYRDCLYAMKPLPPHDASQTLAWDPEFELRLPALGGVLQARPVTGSGLATKLQDRASWTVRFRKGGEQCRLPGRPGRHDLKKLFQEQGIPPWQRDRIPLVYIHEELAAVAGLWVCAPFAAGPDEPGYEIEWCIRQHPIQP